MNLLKLLEAKINKSFGLQKILQNISWLFFDKIFRYGIGLFVGIWFARYLGPEKYGIYNFAIAFSAIFGVVVGLGLKVIVVRELVKTPKLENQILGSAFVMIFFAALLTWALTAITVLSFYSDDILTCYLVLIISAGFVFQPFQSIGYYFESKVESKKVVFAANLGFVISSIFKIILILTSQELVAFALVGLFDVFLTSISLVVVFRMNNLSILNWKWDPLIAKPLLRDSSPLILSAVMVVIYMRIDQIMLKEMVSDRELGLYSVAVKLTELWYFLPAIIQSSFLPKIIRAKEVSRENFMKIIQKLFSFMIFFSVAIGIVTSFFGQLIVLMLFGEGYAESGKMLIVLIWSLLFVSLGIARSAYLIPENLTRVHLYTVLIGTITNIVLNIILIPKYAGFGAVIATLVAYSIAAYATCFIFPSTREIGFLMTKSFFQTPVIVIRYCKKIMNLIKRKSW